MAGGFNKAMLQLAREMRGWTQTRLATESGITQAYISQLENGQKQDASPEKLDRLANVLAVPVSFFFQAERYDGLGLSLVFHRKKASARIGHVRRLQAEVNLRRIHVARVLRGVDLNAPKDFRFMSIDDYDGDAEKIAAFVRINWKLPLGPVPNLVKVIEDAGGIVFRFSFGTTDIDAISQWTSDTPPLFFVNADAPADRARFSLAHEIGHLVMHDAASDTMETEANQFASELLMPRREIAPHLAGITLKKAYALKQYWRVSIQALIRRARDIGSIDQRTYSRLFVRIGALGMRRTELSPLTPEYPRLADQILSAYQVNTNCSDQDLAAVLDLRHEGFRELYGPPSGTLRVVN